MFRCTCNTNQPVISHRLASVLNDTPTPQRVEIWDVFPEEGEYTGGALVLRGTLSPGETLVSDVRLQMGDMAAVVVWVSDDTQKRLVVGVGSEVRVSDVLDRGETIRFEPVFPHRPWAGG